MLRSVAQLGSVLFIWNRGAEHPDTTLPWFRLQGGGEEDELLLFRRLGVRLSEKKEKV